MSAFEERGMINSSKMENNFKKVRHPDGGCVFCASGFYGFFDEKNNKSYFYFTFLPDKHQGPPGHVHGGVIAIFIDEVMNFATGNFFPCFLGKIEILYKKPVPLGVSLRLEGEVVKVEGRKIFTNGFIIHEKESGERDILIQASGIYIRPKGSDGTVSLFVVED
jgi:acyl-coenzyme A thioesterase PaaI-like protein